MNPSDPLQQLHDIVEAPAIDWWPLAPGWWVLLICGTGLLCLGLHTVYKRHAGLYWKRQAFQELRQLEAEYFRSTPDLSEELSNRHAARLNSEVNIFLKRVLSSQYPHRDFRAQNPDQWRVSLDEQITVLSEREKDILTHGQYMPNAARLERATFTSLLAWLKGLR